MKKSVKEVVIGKSAPCANAREAAADERSQSDYLCPVCYAVIPPEHLGRKVWCRWCGYLESCCNPY